MIQLVLVLGSFIKFSERQNMNYKEKKQNDNPIQAGVNLLMKKGFKKIKADVLEDYEDPKSLVKASNQDAFTPDITMVKNGRRFFCDIALKTEKIRRLVSKWRLMETLAAVKESKLYLLVPRGSLSFTKSLVKQYNINTVVVKL